MKTMKRKPSPATTSNGNGISKDWEAVVVDDKDDIEQNIHSLSHDYYPSHGLTSIEAHELTLIHGRNELPEKIVPKWYIFISLFWEPMPIMIWIAIIIEAILGKWMDMSILLAIQITNASIAFYETTKSGDAVAALKASLKPLATVKRDGEWKQIDAASLVPGDLVTLANGSAIPADCRINEGTLEVDLSTITGETLPVVKFKGDLCEMGATVARGEVEATVTYTGLKTSFGKTAHMLQVNKNTK